MNAEEKDYDKAAKLNEEHRSIKTKIDALGNSLDHVKEIIENGDEVMEEDDGWFIVSITLNYLNFTTSNKYIKETSSKGKDCLLI